MSEFGGAGSGLPVVATTPAIGIPLINGTQNILQWTAPNDGNIHVVEWALILVTTAPATGGAIGIAYTIGGNAITGTPAGQPVINPNQAAGNAIPGVSSGQTCTVIDPNTTITISQSTALTAGASKIWGVMFAK